PVKLSLQCASASFVRASSPVTSPKRGAMLSACASRPPKPPAPTSPPPTPPPPKSGSGRCAPSSKSDDHPPEPCDPAPRSLPPSQDGSPPGPRSSLPQRFFMRPS